MVPHLSFSLFYNKYGTPWSPMYTQMLFLSPTPFKSLPSMTCGPFTVGHHTVYADAIPIAHPFKSLPSMTCGPFIVGDHAVYAGAIPIAHPLQIPSQHDMWTLHSWRSRCIRRCNSYCPPLQIPSQHDMWTLHSWPSRCIRRCNSYRAPPSNPFPAWHVDPSQLAITLYTDCLLYTSDAADE